MRLLFDQNLSPRLDQSLRDLYPESLHVRSVGLESASDYVVWQYARDNRLTIVSKDSDFRQLSFTLGYPWIPSESNMDSARELLDHRNRIDPSTPAR